MTDPDPYTKDMRIVVGFIYPQSAKTTGTKTTSVSPAATVFLGDMLHVNHINQNEK